MLQMSLLGLEHSMTVGGMQTGHRAQPEHAPDTHERTALEKGLTNTREEQGGKAKGGAEAKAEGVTWPLLLHASSGHWPGSTVLQLVSSRPRLPFSDPLGQMGRQIPSLPICPAASSTTNRQKRQNKIKNKKNKMPP